MNEQSLKALNDFVKSLSPLEKLTELKELEQYINKLKKEKQLTVI